MTPDNAGSINRTPTESKAYALLLQETEEYKNFVRET
jgi:hypothetical protein